MIMLCAYLTSSSSVTFLRILPIKGYNSGNIRSRNIHNTSYPYGPHPLTFELDPVLKGTVKPELTANICGPFSSFYDIKDT